MVGILKTLYRRIVPDFIRKPIRYRILENQFHYDAEIEFYGAYEVLRKHVGIEKIPYEDRRNLNWTHGWYADFFMKYLDDPYMATCNIHYKKPERFNFVTRTSQEKFLKEHGYSNCKAIGLPIVYIPQKRIKRKPRSLLVMPTHTLEGFELKTFEEEYALLIDSFKTDFDDVRIMIHPACFKNNKWVNTFKAHGYKIIKGVQLNDKRSFYRMRDIMSQYEYVTTNGFGSHMMYASYFGAKVSIIGREVQFDMSVLEKDESFTGEDRSVLYKSVTIVSTPNYKFHYPDFYVDHPLKAVLHKEMADYELGVQNRISKSEFDSIVRHHLQDRSAMRNERESVQKMEAL